MNELTGFDRVRYIQLLTDLIRNEMEGRNSLEAKEIAFSDKTIKLLKEKIKTVLEEL
jgi:hypothetical protein